MAVTYGSYINRKTCLFFKNTIKKIIYWKFATILTWHPSKPSVTTSAVIVNYFGQYFIINNPYKLCIVTHELTFTF